MNWNLGFSFGAPWWLLGLLLLPVLAWTRNRIGREGAFIYSSLNLMKGITELSRSRAGTVLNNLRWIGLVLLILGIQGFLLALVGEYLGRIRRDVEGRPLYMVDREI